MVNVYCLMPSVLTDTHVTNEISRLFGSENKVPQISRLIIIFATNIAMLPLPDFQTTLRKHLPFHSSPWNSWRLYSLAPSGCETSTLRCPNLNQSPSPGRSEFRMSQVAQRLFQLEWWIWCLGDPWSIMVDENPRLGPTEALWKNSPFNKSITTNTDSSLFPLSQKREHTPVVCGIIKICDLMLITLALYNQWINHESCIVSSSCIGGIPLLVLVAQSNLTPILQMLITKIPCLDILKKHSLYFNI